MPRRKEERSPRQQRILAFIQRSVAITGRPPTVREIGESEGLKSTSVVDYHLRALEGVGAIRRDPRVSRGIELVGEAANSFSGAFIGVPVQGRIAAGEPIEAASDLAESILLPPVLATEDAYALRVKGKSMIDDLIDDGDLVVVRPQQTADNGDIVVALLTDGPTGQGAATLKRVFREQGRIRLQPANPTMAPIYVQPDNLVIQGKVIAVIRSLV